MMTDLLCMLQVSICKFKFTGGDRPTLEKRKMLSVDSGGNLRYYNSSDIEGPTVNYDKAGKEE